MNRKRYRFLELMGNIDDELVFRSCQPWREEGKKRMFSHYGKMAACAILVLMLCMTGIFHQQVEAAIRNFTVHIAEMLGVSGNLEPYTQVIGVSQKKDGVTLTLEEVILAENQLYAAFHIEWDEGVEIKDGMMSPGLSADAPKINGEEVENVSSVIADYDNDKELGVTHDLLISFDYEDGVLPQDIREIEMEARVYLSAQIEDEGIPFPFHFSASKEELQKDTYAVPVGEEVKAGDGVVLQFQELQLSRVFSRISASVNEGYQKKMSDTEYVLLGKDSEGNTLRYEMAGGTGKNVIFKCVGSLPSMDSRWVELQLFEAKLPIEWEMDASQEDEAANEESISADEEDVAAVSGAWTSDDLNFVPVGDKFRVEVRQPHIK